MIGSDVMCVTQICRLSILSPMNSTLGAMSRRTRSLASNFNKKTKIQIPFLSSKNYSTEATGHDEYVPDLPTHLRGVYNYAKARNAYRREVSKLRIQFAAEYSAKQQKQKAEEEAERNKVQQEKAARMVIKKAKQEEQSKKFAEAQELAKQEREKKLQEKAAHRNNLNNKFKEVNQKLVENLNANSTQWITMSNLNERIAEDLFIPTGKDSWKREPFQSDVVKSFVANLQKNANLSKDEKSQ